MAHYAFLDMTNVVTEVIVGKDEGDTNTNWELQYQDVRKQVCKRTSYNTSGGVHSGGGTPYRKNYAGIGYFYDSTRDAFIPPQPFNSWTLNEDTCLWDSPVAYPEDGKLYKWNEEIVNWEVIEE
tara:strand:+ start:1002 stop:1373 length:372 start_codon:yes stop_codon:yes gene_type:complete